MAITGSTISSAFDLMATRLDYLKQRHAVVAHNVANADSPGFKASDLQGFEKAIKGEVGVRPVFVNVTNQAHIATSNKGSDSFAENKRVQSYEVVPTGNSVVLEEQMMKVAEISSDYQLITNLYKRTQGMVRIALGRV